jgi:hypothetical protein
MMVLIAFYTEQPLTVSTTDPVSLENVQTVHVAPNPVNGTATFTLPEGVTSVNRFNLLNMTGQIVVQKRDLQGNTFDIDLSHIPPGCYVYDIDGSVGKLYKW